MSRATTHLQTLLGLEVDRLREMDETKSKEDTLRAELAGTTGAEALRVGILHVFGHGQIGWTKIPNKIPDYSQDPHFANSEEEEIQDSELLEILEKTKLFLDEKCTQSVPNSVRRKVRSRYPRPKVAATRTPRLDAYIKSEVPHHVKSADKDLAKIQTFVLDALAPLVSILDVNSRDHCPAYQDTIDEISTAEELTGNGNATISRLR